MLARWNGGMEPTTVRSCGQNAFVCTPSPSRLVERAGLTSGRTRPRLILRGYKKFGVAIGPVLGLAVRWRSSSENLLYATNPPVKASPSCQPGNRSVPRQAGPRSSGRRSHVTPQNTESKRDIAGLVVARNCLAFPGARAARGLVPVSAKPRLLGTC